MKRLFLNLYIAVSTALSFTCCGGGGSDTQDFDATVNAEDFYSGKKTIYAGTGTMEMALYVEADNRYGSVVPGYLIFGAMQRYNVGKFDYVVDNEEKPTKATIDISINELNTTNSKVRAFFGVPVGANSFTWGYIPDEAIGAPLHMEIDFTTMQFSLTIPEAAEYNVDSGSTTKDIPLAEQYPDGVLTGAVLVSQNASGN